MTTNTHDIEDGKLNDKSDGKDKSVVSTNKTNGWSRDKAFTGDDRFVGRGIHVE
jgi:hypothetical protein